MEGGAYDEAIYTSVSLVDLKSVVFSHTYPRLVPQGTLCALFCTSSILLCQVVFPLLTGVLLPTSVSDSQFEVSNSHE